MTTRLVIAILSVLIGSLSIAAAEPDSKEAWKLPKEDAEKWVKRIRLLTGDGWTVSANGNDIIIQRCKAVRFGDGAPNQPDLGNREPRLVEGKFKLTLEFAPKMSLDEYERLA